MSADQPANPFAVSLPPGSATQLKSIGRGGEIYASETHGKYYTAAYYSRMFNFNVTAVTVPKTAINFASVFSLYNPPNSQANLELVDVDVGIVLATIVPGVLGWYWVGPTLAALGTLGTIGVFGTNWFAGNLGSTPGQGNPYSSYTHVAAAAAIVRVDIITTFAGVTATSAAPIHKEYDGKLVVGVGSVISIAMSTNPGTASGMDLSVRWIECPLT